MDIQRHYDYGHGGLMSEDMEAYGIEKKNETEGMGRGGRERRGEGDGIESRIKGEGREERTKMAR